MPEEQNLEEFLKQQADLQGGLQQPQQQAPAPDSQQQNGQLQADPFSDLGEDLSPKARARIEQLLNRNKELEKVLNLDKKVDNLANLSAQQQQMMWQQQQAEIQRQREQSQQQNFQNQPQDDQWTPWMTPKVDPIIRRQLAPIEQFANQLADRVDQLQVMQQFPEYAKDPELAQRVERIQQERFAQSGMRLSRADILTYLRGTPEFVEKLAQERAEKLIKERSAPAPQQQSQTNFNAPFIEGNAPVSAARPILNAPNKKLDDWTVEEMEKFMNENPAFAVVR